METATLKLAVVPDTEQSQYHPHHSLNTTTLAIKTGKAHTTASINTEITTVSSMNHDGEEALTS